MLKSAKVSLRQKIILVIFGLLLSLVLLEIGMRVAGSMLLSIQEHVNMLAMKKRGTYRILCLGESTTAGGNTSYPDLLEKFLNRRNIGIKFTVINKGISGLATWDILEQLEANLDKYKPNLVITMMGINDFGRHMPYQEMNQGRPKFFWQYLKIYKLYKFVLLHAKNKKNEIKLGIKGTFPQKKRILPEEDLIKKIRLDPQNEQAYIDLAYLHEKQGRYQESEEELLRAVAINPKNTQALSRLGFVYRIQGKMDKAEKCLLKAAELNPSDSWTYQNLGEVYEGGRY